MEKIVIHKFKREKGLAGVVRIQPDAERLVQKICIQEDIPASEVVSKIIIAAAPFVYFTSEEE